MTTPITPSLPPLMCLPRGEGLGRSVVSGDAGVSARTSFAGLSSRNPLKAACRTMPSAVNPANSISATSFGFTQVQSLPLRGAFLPPNGLSLVLRPLSFLSRSPALRALKPVPTGLYE